MTFPATWTRVPVSGKYIDAQGNARYGSVMFESPTLLSTDGYVIAADRIVVPLDVNGQFTFSLPSTNSTSVTPSGWAWKVTEQFPGARDSFYVFIDKAVASYDMATITVAAAAPQVVIYALASELASTLAGEGASLIGVDDSVAGLGVTQLQQAIEALAGRNYPKTKDPVAEVLRKMADGIAVKLVCIGDSITYGQLDSTGLQATQPFPVRLQNLLQDYYNNTGITVVNKGVQGSTVAGMISRFSTDVTAEAPDIILFNGGQNDSRPPNNVSITQYVQDVQSYLKLCGNTPVIMWGVSPRSFENLGSNVVDFYRRCFESVALARDIPFIETNARFVELYKSRTYGRGRISVDGAHLSEEGYRWLGDLIFSKGFANDDLFIKPGQFKDISGQWLFKKTGTYILGGSNQQDAKSLTMSTDGLGGTAKLYLFLEEWDECDLVLHTTINNGTAGQQVNLQHFGTGSTLSVTLSPALASGATWYANDYPITTIRLRPGINNIQLSDVAGSQWAINGFSVKRRKWPLERGGYLATYNEASDTSQAADFWGASYGSGGLAGARPLRMDPLILSSGSHITPLCDIDVPSFSEFNARWRIRATVTPGSVLHFGQQSNSTVDYMPVWSLTLDGTNAVFKCRDATNAQRTQATVALAVAAGGQTVKIDFNATPTGWGIYVNDTLIFTESVPLSNGVLYVQSPASTGAFFNPPLLRLEGSAYNDILRGERWISYEDNKLHIIGTGSLEKTLTFA